MKPHAASERGGWAVRLHRKDGTSDLNSFSLGDVVVYDSEDAAYHAACAINDRVTCLGADSPYRLLTIEKVEKGTWSPSAIDALFLAALPYIEAAGTSEARVLGNEIRSRLSPYAPEEMRKPR